MIAEFETVFDTELHALQEDFCAQIKTIRACAYNSDVIINALDYMASAFSLMVRDTRAMYTRESSVGAWWIESLYNVYEEYAAQVYAVLHDTSEYKPLLRAEKNASWYADALLRWAYNIEAFFNDEFGECSR